MKRFFPPPHLVLVPAMLYTALSCGKAPGSDRCPKPDAVSGATRQAAKPKQEKSPPTHPDYQLLGSRAGLKGSAVRYDAQLVRGGMPLTEQAAAAWKEWGIRTVISVNPEEEERRICEKHGLALVELPFPLEVGPGEEDLRRFLDTVRTGRGPFYVHCVGGTQRAGVLGAAYRIHHLGWHADRAVVDFARLGGNLQENHHMVEKVLSFVPQKEQP